jgi:rubrerythrin
MELKGSKTEQNLKTAFAGESNAYTKYSIYASQAKKEGFNQISNIFNETASNERTHAKMWLKELHGGGVPDTEANLIDAIAGEYYEWDEMYVGFAKTAKEEGFTRIAGLFEMVGKIEKSHEARYKKLKEEVAKGTVFARETEQVWVCMECGHVHIGTHAPEKCPVCGHPQAYFEIKPTNY